MIVKKILGDLKRKYKNYRCKVKWEKVNKHNHTYAGTTFDINKVKVGKNTYGMLNVIHYENPSAQLIIGNYCSIAENVYFLLGGEHHPKDISNYTFCVLGDKEKVLNDMDTKGPIVIKDDVWIGFNSLILSGVTIGQGAIVAAGSVVTKNVPSYAVVGGVPAKIIKYRFEDEIISKLKGFSYLDISEKNIKKNIDCFYTNINRNNIDTIIDTIKKE